VVDAVRCAIEVQNGIIERNAGVAPERRIEFRVGIHLGDVVEEPDEATNSGSLREPNSNPRRERQSDSGARLLAGVWSRLVMNRPLTGGRGCLPPGLEVGGAGLKTRQSGGVLLKALSDQMLAAPLTVVGLAHEQSVPIF
jgi:hypothetical protein